MKTQKTYQTKTSEVKRNWHLIDAKGKVLGRLATQIATLLQGKHKVVYTPHIDCGDYVVVVNARGIVLTGKKDEQKVYYRHSGYLGNLKEISVSKLRQDQPGRIIELAVSRMLPKNRLQSGRMRRLKISTDDTNPYEEKFKS